MKLIEQWEQAKREIETALAQGRIDPGAATDEIAKLDYRITRRPFILKRRKDRKAWEAAQTAALIASTMKPSASANAPQIALQAPHPSVINPDTAATGA